MCVLTIFMSLYLRILVCPIFLSFVEAATADIWIFNGGQNVQRIGVESFAYLFVCCSHQNGNIEEGGDGNLCVSQWKGNYRNCNRNKGWVRLTDQMNFRKSSERGGVGGHFQSKNLYCKILTFKQGFFSMKVIQKGLLGYVFTLLPCWTFVLHASHGK